MPRPLRLECSGTIYHVSACGNAKVVSGAARVSANGGTLLWNEIARLSIRFTPVISRNHVGNFLPLIDFVKESPGNNAVAPGWRFPILQSLDIGTVMWVGSQLGIGIGF